MGWQGKRKRSNTRWHLLTPHGRAQDGFKPANAWVANGVAWLDDIQGFYRERAAIEKDYAKQLTALANKYFEKKAKKSAGLGVGDTPTMTPGSIER